MSAAPILEVKDLRAWYGSTQALFGIDLQILRGGITALLGANGAGKTTLLRSICAQLRTAGELVFDGRSIAGRAIEDIARLGIAHVPEGRGTFTNLSVEENLRIGSHTRRDASEVRAGLGRVFGYFPRLKERLAQQAGTLSGGEQQMLAIARALLLKPRLILLDEPSFGLAPRIVQEIFDIMRVINVEERVSILLVEQNARQALALAGHAVLIETGRVVLEGPAEQIAGDPRIRQIYLGG
jgi:branched-chain amino acid transport system ATP-binding protein